MNMSAIWTRLRTIVGRGRVRRFAPQTTPRSMQVELLRGEVLDGVQLVQQAGFSSRPRVGSEVVVVSVGGDRSHPVAIGTVDRKHLGPELAEGDVALFATTSSGAVVLIRGDGTVSILGDVEIEGNLAVTGSIEAGGEVADARGTVSEFRDQYNQHTHLDSQSGSTGPPTPQAP